MMENGKDIMRGDNGQLADGSVPERIVKFIRKHHVMTLASVSDNGEPWCANIFYSYIPESNVFVFTTEEKTRHGREMAANGFVAGSIVLETRTVGMVQGLQIQGRAERVQGETIKKAKNSYIRKYPYAAMADLDLWTLSPTKYKLTDNRLGFGKKLHWEAQGGRCEHDLTAD